MKLFKKSLLILIACFTMGTASAQVGYNFAQYDLGLGAGLNKVYSDAQTFTTTPTAHFTFTYNTTPFVNYVIEVQAGQLKGGDSLNTSTGRQFNNQFAAVMFKGQLQMGEVIDYSDSKLANAFKNLYFSTGVGFTVNQLKYASRYSAQVPDFYNPGRDNSTEILIPARIGYEFKVFNKYGIPTFKIDAAYQHNFILGDALDGYEVGRQKDSFSQVTLGIKFSVGGITSYRKSIAY